MDMSLDALTVAGLVLLVLIAGLSVYLCNRRGATCNDRGPPGDDPDSSGR